MFKNFVAYTIAVFCFLGFVSACQQEEAREKKIEAPKESRPKQKAQSLEKKKYRVCGQEMLLEVADDYEEQMIGLMHRKGIPEGTGMIFIYRRPQSLSFWMKNVPFDIDIGYFDAQGFFLNHHTMKGTSVMEKSSRLPSYKSKEGAVYAVEVPKGFYSQVKELKNCRLEGVDL